MPVHTRSLSSLERESLRPKSDLRPQLVSGHENLQSDGFRVEVDGIFFLDNSQKFQHYFSKRNVVSLGIPSDFTSEWITLFSNRKMTTRYLYRLIILPRLPADKLWCVRARRIPYGRIFTLEFHLEFHLELQVILQVNGSQFFVTEKWSHGTFIYRLCLPYNLPANCDVCELCV